MTLIGEGYEFQAIAGTLHLIKKNIFLAFLDLVNT
jgi:hypothetical protein